MKTDRTSPPRWSTASRGHTVDTSPMELAALGQHLALCRGSSHHLFALRCAAETMSGFATARFVTTILVFSLAIGAGFLVF